MPPSVPRDKRKSRLHGHVQPGVQISVYRSVERTISHVILSGVRSTESKNLRIMTCICIKIGAKILRLAYGSLRMT